MMDLAKYSSFVSERYPKHCDYGEDMQNISRSWTGVFIIIIITICLFVIIYIYGYESIGTTCVRLISPAFYVNKPSPEKGNLFMGQYNIRPV